MEINLRHSQKHSENSVYKLSFRLVIPALFTLLVLLQLFDLDSTLHASIHQHETNKLINWLAERIGFKSALIVIKIFAISIICFLYKIWKLSENTHNAEFTICLSLITFVYSFVVAINYYH